MAFEAWIYFTALFCTLILLFIIVYEAIMYSDLECDYINPVDCCRSVNRLFYPHLMLQLWLTFSTGLLTMNVFVLLLQGSMSAFKLHKVWRNRTRGLSCLLEPTDIFPKLRLLKLETFFNLAFYLSSFFIYLYLLVSTILSD